MYPSLWGLKLKDQHIPPVLVVRGHKLCTLHTHTHQYMSDFFITSVYNNRDKEGNWSSTSGKKRLMTSWSVSKSFSGTSVVIHWLVTIRGTTSDTLTPSIHSHSPQTQSYLQTLCVSTLRMITREETYRWSIGIPFHTTRLVVYHPPCCLLLFIMNR